MIACQIKVKHDFRIFLIPEKHKTLKRWHKFGGKAKYQRQPPQLNIVYQMT
jgi:hypothetical protein